MKLYIALICTLCILANPVSGDIINVPTDQPTIQAAINSTVDGDTVLVADGTYFENIDFKGKNITVGSFFIFDRDTSHIRNTVIDGCQPSHPDSGSVVYFISEEDNSTILTGLTITGGSGTVISTPDFEIKKGGGGIFCLNSSPRIEHNLVKNNIVENTSSAAGGGIFAFATANVDNFVIEYNSIEFNSLTADSTAYGGGIFLATNGNMTNNFISSNKIFAAIESAGGGIFAASWSENWLSIELNNNIIENNLVAADYLNWGAGVLLASLNQNSNVKKNIFHDNSFQNIDCRGGGLCTVFTLQYRIQQNRFKENHAGYGGGIATWYSSPIIQGNLIVKNKAKTGGGLWINKFPFSSKEMDDRILSLEEELKNKANIFNKLKIRYEEANINIEENESQVINNTILSNQASENTGGLFSGTGICYIMNSILWENEAPESEQIGGTVVINYSDIQGGFYGLGNIDLDPVFSDSVDFYLSQSESPCIDAGNPHPDFFDLEDPNRPGFPLFPALGTLKNDMGVYGGNPDVTPAVDLIFGSQFRAFHKRVMSAQIWERTAIVDSFMVTVSSFPFVEGSNYAYFIYRGNISSVNAPGDATDWNPTASPLTRIPGTDFWYRQDVYESDARLDYKFVLNGNNWILDPRNPRTVTGGFGPNSELPMPDYVQAPEIEYDPTIPHGTLHDTTFYSANLGNSRRIRIYTPPSYTTASSDSFPMILFHDGLEYISLGSAVNVIDYLIAEERIQPIVAVFVPPVNRNDEYAFNQTDKFETFIVDELMPFIDSKYRIKRNPAFRAMTGPSFGGLITTQICYNHPDVFGLCAPYSPSYWAKEMKVYLSVVNGEMKNLKFYLDWGSYETGIMFDARNFRDIISAKGYELKWREWHEGHSWGSWRAHIDEALEFFFPPSALKINENRGDVPIKFFLAQNYPNPFNPTTTIHYTLPEAAQVVLKIYNIKGQEVKTLVNEYQKPGEKLVVWNGKNQNDETVNSGIYFYHMKLGENTYSRKMLFLK